MSGMWDPFAGGESIGEIGSEGGEIVLDEELEGVSRISLERGCRSSVYAITCGIYGWMVHTRFFDAERRAREAYEVMKVELAAIVARIPAAEDADEPSMRGVVEAIERFVPRRSRDLTHLCSREVDQEVDRSGSLLERV